MDTSNLNQSRGIRAEEIRIAGIVQGVGFRPTVYRLAIECGLAGSVANDGAGVIIRVAGDPQNIDLFLHRLAQERPPLARIDTVVRTPILVSAMEMGGTADAHQPPVVATDSLDCRSPLPPIQAASSASSASADASVDAEDSLALGQRTAMELHRNRHPSPETAAPELTIDLAPDLPDLPNLTDANGTPDPNAYESLLLNPLSITPTSVTSDQLLQGQRCPLHLRPERRYDYNSVAARSPHPLVDRADQPQGQLQGQRQAPDRPHHAHSAQTAGEPPELVAPHPHPHASVSGSLESAQRLGEPERETTGTDDSHPLPQDESPPDAIDPTDPEALTSIVTYGDSEASAPSTRSMSRSRLNEIFDTSPGARPNPIGRKRSASPEQTPPGEAIAPDAIANDSIANDAIAPDHSTEAVTETAIEPAGSAAPPLPTSPIPPAISQSLSDALAGELANLLEPAIDRLTHDHTADQDFLDLADQFKRPAPPARPVSPPTLLPSPVAHRPQPIDLSSGELLGRSAMPAFRIVDSQPGPVRTQIAPDTATCAACLRDLNDPHSRFYRYPFVNCTHCGPRLTVIRSLPYDRARTSMAGFQLCTDCGQDYDNPGDRRFHAQPTACPTCGPMVWFERLGQQQPIVKDDRAIEQAAIALMQGSIVAIKGIGGVHLACDATQEAVVQRLRLRKHRPQKPLAVMVRNLEMARRFCQINDHERSLLTGAAAPIVLLTLTDPGQIAAAVAPGLTEIGVMLPYSPLHHLLMGYLDRPIVLTSGNRAGEPQCIDNQEARIQLQAVADAFLLHNRPILHRVDDSVVRVLPKAVQVLRRSRGYAPMPIALPPGLTKSPPILAMGNDLKNSLCLTRDGQAVLSPYIGDLDSPACLKSYTQTIAQFRSLFDHRPSAIAVDSHPDGQSVKAGEELAKALEVPLLRIQHHHAHIATCMVDNRWGLEQPPVLGIALDGMGWGSDGTIWGGELLWTTYNQSRRVGALRPARLLGGNRAAREPWRNLYAQLHAAGLLDRLDRTAHFANQPLNLIEGIAHSGLNSPWSSSCGRLFDAVAAFLGLWPDRISYEGQAAIALENLASQALDLDQEAYPIELLSESVLWLNPTVLWEAMLADRACGVPPSVIALRFHRGIAQGLIQAVETLHDRGLYFGAIACGGGVFQNRLLLTCLEAALTESPLRYPLLLPQQVPANDGGLALGQAAIAAAWMNLGHL
ncbi:MAG TPA: carbamoyltransferase HypF [Coleofasciculaceae cyanobacterium]